MLFTSTLQTAQAVFTLLDPSHPPPESMATLSAETRLVTAILYHDADMNAAVLSATGRPVRSGSPLKGVEKLAIAARRHGGRMAKVYTAVQAKLGGMASAVARKNPLDKTQQRVTLVKRGTTTMKPVSAATKYNADDATSRTELATKLKERLGEAGFKLSEDRTRDPGRTYSGFKGREEVFVFQHRKDPGLEVQVFTSIVSGGEVRSKGADAIRVCLVYKNKAKQEKADHAEAKQYDLGSECRVNRTGNIDDIVDRTVERARDAYKRANDVDRCRDCSAPMALSKQGKHFCSEVCWTKRPGYKAPLKGQAA